MYHNFITIEGNIGVGKTTLATRLSKELNSRLILEEFTNNPFLPKFYKKPQEYAFPLELFFMAERYSQLKKNKEEDIFQPKIISDYFFMKSKLFADNNLASDEKRLFDRLFEIMLASLKSPDLVVYLYSDIDRLQQNIKKRGRLYEAQISDNYLINIQKKYLDYLNKQNNFPVVILDVSKVDFTKDETIYKKIKSVINKRYELGVHNISLL